MNPLKIVFVLTFVTLVNGYAIAQKDSLVELENTFPAQYYGRQGVKVGFSGGKHMFGEISWYAEEVVHFAGWPMFNGPGIHIGSEFGYVDKLIVAPKIGTRIHIALPQVGLSFLWYSDLKGGYAPTLRPEIGIGIAHQFELLYAYNWDFVNENLNSINSHMLTFRFNLTILERRKYIDDSDNHSSWKSVL
ncbi:MAG: hypothetical protein HWE24_07680 [Oceanospirillaceae bacterium]|nr:hypothetical protein [Oceanospirillaceae bacterium]